MVVVLFFLVFTNPFWRRKSICNTYCFVIFSVINPNENEEDEREEEANPGLWSGF